MPGSDLHHHYLASRAPEHQSPEELQNLVRELQVHQLELAAQNEELQLVHTEIQLAQARYFDLYHKAPVSYFTLNEYGAVEELNQMACQQLQITRNSALGRPFAQFVAVGNREAFRHFIADLLINTTSQSDELQLRRPDGTTMMVHLEGRCEKNGPVFQCHLAVFDVTARHQAAQALADSEQRFRLLAENVPGVLYEWQENQDGTRHFGYVSPKLQELFGIPPGQDMVQFVHPADREPLRASVAESNQTGEPWSYEGRFVVPGQPVRWWRGSAVATTRGEKTITYRGLILDITPLRMAEAAVSWREEKYRGIIENMQLGLVETDLNDHLLYANQSFCTLTGFDYDDLTGQPLSPLLPASDAQPEPPEQQATASPAVLPSTEMTLTTKQGQVKWVLVSRTPLYGDARQLCGSISIYLDITAQKALEVNLRAAKANAEMSARVKHDFLANMSHEIRTPLNAVIGMSHLLTQTPLLPQQTTYLDAIKASAEDLLVLVNDVLDLAKIEAGKMEADVAGFRLADVWTQVAQTLRYKAEDKGLAFITKLDPALPAVVRGDARRLTQILLNLVGNALKFTDKGSVEMVCELAEPQLGTEVQVNFTVRDTGIGISPAYLASAFDDFSQQDPSVTRQFGGTGLGLGICQRLVALLGGVMHLESQLGEGTTAHFALRLPVGTPTDLPAHTPAGDVTLLREALQGKRVLLVEDNAFNRLLAKTYLVRAKLEVTEAENGAIAVELAQTATFDIVLMDVQMPVLNGYEATAQLRHQLGLTLPIIALTANAIEGERDECIAAGMDDYLTKPFREAVLVQLVHDWVCSPQAHQPAPIKAAYQLDLLTEAAAGDPALLAHLLTAFVADSEQTLSELTQALEAGDVAGLRAAAHKLRPGLEQLQVASVLAPLLTLEDYQEPFEEEKLEPLVRAIVNRLRPILAQMERDAAG